METLNLLQRGMKLKSPFVEPGGRRGEYVQLASLHSLTKSDIFAALGHPTYECHADHDVAGCTRRGDVFYSFYPAFTGLGGGPELSLSFDDAGRCSRAEWLLSQ